ncbi:targeting protein for Xklp2 homolog [Colletes gigas]|uniref:targeting protein for Xklp2 homolog n=1 Tax=Colletes gigas TaxID=935657 RepID=UPI001C9AC6DC|nr:targeting protein for Xklp2 homolog [Colletes gigas]
MDEYCAPQWTDFTCSPQLPSDSFFDVHIEYEAHKPLMQLKSNLKSNLSVFHKNNSIDKSTNTKTHFDDSLELVQNAKDNITYSIPHNNKKHSVKTKTENSLSKVKDKTKMYKDKQSQPEVLMCQYRKQRVVKTHPISPPLRSVQRVGRTNNLGKEEREALQLEDMRKHKIKANPVPLNILKAPSTLKKIAKKPLIIPEKSCSEINTTQHSINNNVKCAEKKLEKLKNLQIQDSNKIKVEFHARPVPKFLKLTKPIEKQSRTIEEQTVKKRTVVSHPFSFAERDERLAQKKKEFVKQMQENDKTIKVFRANPVPNFKKVKIPNVKNTVKSVTTKQIKSCNNQENKQPNIRVPLIDTKRKPAMQNIVKNIKKKEHAS